VKEKDERKKIKRILDEKPLIRYHISHSTLPTATRPTSDNFNLIISSIFLNLAGDRGVVVIPTSEAEGTRAGGAFNH